MRTTVAALLAVAAVSTAAAPSALAAQQREEFFWSGPVAPGRTVDVRSLNGSIRAERSSGSEVEVVAVKTARRNDPSEVTIEVIPHADGITVCAVYPSPSGSRPNECSPGNYSMNTRNNDVQVEFTLRIPDGVRLEARTTNGGVEVNGLTADVDARSTNGGITISTRGMARARTTNGPIDVTLGSLSGNDPLEFQTTNGSITLTVPAGLNADFRAQTTNGSISSDLPITVQGSFGPRRLEGVIGSGGRSIVLQTTNGNVRLRQS
jgi:hypothetical protein